MQGYIRFHGGPLHNKHLGIRDWSMPIDAQVRDKLTAMSFVSIQDHPAKVSFKVVVYRCQQIRYGNTAFYEYHLADAKDCGEIEEPLPQEKCDRFAFYMTPAVNATGRLVLVSPAGDLLRKQLREMVNRLREE